MPDEIPGASTGPPPAPSAAAPLVPSGPTINIADEFGTAKRNLPPAKIVLIAIAGVLVVVAIASFLKRATPQGDGSLNNVVAIEIPGIADTMVAMSVTLLISGYIIISARHIVA